MKIRKIIITIYCVKKSFFQQKKNFMNITEAGLELLLKKLNDQITSTVESLKDSEISIMTNKIPNFHTMIEFRQVRDQFLSKFNNPCPIPEESSYSIDLLRHASDDYELPEDTNSSLERFFQSEQERVSRLRNTVLSRCTQPEFFSITQMEFALYDKYVTKYLYGCQEGILRLKSKEYASFTINDLMLELYATFFHKRRKAFLRSLLIHVRRFSLTSQQSIFTRMFDSITQSYKEDMSKTPVPFLPDKVEPINNELQRLSNRLNVDFDLEINDGQQFLYNCRKKFYDLFKALDFYDLPRKKYDFSHYPHQTNIGQLTNHTLISINPHDTKLKDVFNSLLGLSMDELNQKIKKRVSAYNLWVGNEYRSVHFHGEKERKPIPLYKIDSWYQLRYIHAKYLAVAVLSHMNYFQYLCAQLLASKPSVMRSTQFRSRQSKFKEIIEIFDSNGPFIFEDALTFYQALVNSLIGVGSYYISKFEETAADRKGSDSVIVDYESIVERLLQNELDFLNAKRMLVQPLIECLEHKLDDHLTSQIFDIIIERPNFNLPVYNSFEVPYKMAIKLMQKKANVIRTLVNLQILHERLFSSQFSDPIPIFDRPSQISIDTKYRSFYESIEISPFEVYESLSDISKFIDFVPKLAQELGESIDLKTSKYGEYLKISIWEEIEKINKNVFENGFFPFDRSSTTFHFQLSDIVKSLFISPYVNTVDAIKKLISKMKESRKLRFMLSTRRFMHLAWKLQTLIIETDLLQHAYYTQCDQLGITEKGIRMTPFKDSATKEIIDLHSETFDINVLEVALTEFELISLKFDQSSSIKDIIFAADFSGLKRMIRFQKLQNTIFEIAIRFNRHLIDNNFLVSYFELGADSGMFLTGVDPSDFYGDEENERRYIKSIIADKIFFQPLNIFRDNQLVQKDKDIYCLSIKTLKLMSRTILSAHVKQKSMTQQEMFDLYITEMVDKFAVFGLKVEIAEVCNLERRIILTNTFVDTYILGPDKSTHLIDNQGRFEKFFYVPTWYECFTMMREAPHARQGMVLRSVLKFLVSRFRILNHARFECSLSERIELVFENLYYQHFKLETPVFQKLFNDLSVLPNSKEVDIATKFILENEKYLFHRLEFSFLTSLENFFVSVKSTNEKNKIVDMNFGKKIQFLWLKMHNKLEKDKYLIIASRYSPLWQEHFLYNCIESDRAELATRLNAGDAFIDDSLSSNYNKETLNNPIKKLPLAIDFLCLAISQIHIKFAYFLLRNGIDENKIDLKSTISLINQKVYNENCESWNSVILKQANLHLVPKDESPSRVTDTIPEPKLEQVIFDVIRNEVDLLILASQNHQVEKTIETFTKDVRRLRGLPEEDPIINESENQANLQSGSPNLQLSHNSSSKVRLNKNQSSSIQLSQTPSSSKRTNLNTNSSLQLTQKATTPNRNNNQGQNASSSLQLKQNAKSSVQFNLNAANQSQNTSTPNRNNQSQNTRSSVHFNLNSCSSNQSQNTSTPNRTNQNAGSSIRLNQNASSPIQSNQSQSSSLQLSQNASSTIQSSQNASNSIELSQNASSTIQMNQNASSSIELNQNENSSQVSSSLNDTEVNATENEENEDDDSSFYTKSPAEYDQQFQRESEHAHSRINELFQAKLQECSVTTDDKMIQINLNTLTDSLYKLSSAMKAFEIESLLKENDTWTKYLSNVTVPIEYNKEEMESVSILASLTTKRLQRQADSEIAYRFGPKFITVNQLRQNIRLQELDEVKVEHKMKSKFIDYYDSLVSDLKKSIDETKKKGETIKMKVYDDVMKRVRKARSVSVQMRTVGILHDNTNNSFSSPSESEPPSTFTSQALFSISPPESTEAKKSDSILSEPIFKENLDQNFLNEIDEKNQKLRKEIILLRCLRVLSEVGVKRYYKKVIIENIEQRKLSNTQLWNEKFKSEVHNNSLDSQLFEAHRMLSDSKLEIIKLNQQLENEKMSNIQLVHWKAKNIKNFEAMKKRLDEFDETIEDVNIDNLVKKLAEAQNELDELRENNEAVDFEIEEDVRKPLKIIEEIKNKVKESKMQKRKMDRLQMENEMIHQEEVTNKELFVQELSDANIQLRLANDQLTSQIQELENQKKTKSERAKFLMEETLKARAIPMKMQMRSSTRIVKPAVKKVVTRSLSRI